MVWISKLVLPFVLPPGCCLALLALGLVLLATRRRRAGVAAILLAALSLALASAPAVARRLAAPLEASFAPLDLEAPPQVDSIAVLGGGAGAVLPPRLDPDLADSSDRVWLAARLFAAGAARRVVVSGGRSAAVSEAPPESRAMARLLELWGVPRSAILEEDSSRNTRENCAAIAAIAARENWRRIALVTSALHMPRAFSACARPGLEIVAAPTDFRAIRYGAGTLFDWLPDPSALDLSAAALKEHLALTVWRADAESL